MSREFELPAELTEFENQLRSTPLPPMALNRDELMFRAGVVSVLQRYEATSRSVDEVLSDTASGRTASFFTPSTDKVTTVWPWQLATGSLAALVLFMAFLPRQPDRKESVIADAKVPAAIDIEPIAESTVSYSDNKNAWRWWPNHRFDRLNRFAEIESSVWHRGDSSSAESNEPYTPPKTYRQLLNELLAAPEQQTGLAEPDSL